MVYDTKRSLTIAGHRTSISLEAEFWQALTAIAKKNNQSISKLVSEIDLARGDRNLSSAIRVYVLSKQQNLQSTPNS
jgi:predicted DNA-binding ribbon-helix-helix protein